MSEHPLESGPTWAIHAGPTPNGGVKSLWMFSDDEHRPVPMEQSTRVEIHELDADRNCLFRTYGFMNGAEPAQD
ncbi:MAG: hypothetical protein ACKN9W_13690 [Methylococcus sp.]